jgi:hypothetical protein
MSGNITEPEMLKRIQKAYEVYKDTIGPKLEVERFIQWMYKEYGYVYPDLKPSRND